MAKKNKGGRPPKKLTDEQIIQVEALGATLSIEQMADYFGVGKTTLYSIFERQPEVLERYKKGKAKAINDVAGGLLMDARNGCKASRFFYLKTRAGWSETNKHEHTGADGGELVIKWLDGDDKTSNDTISSEGGAEEAS